MFTLDTSVFIADQHPSELGHASSRALITRLITAGTVLTLPTLLLVEMGGTLARVHDNHEQALLAVQRLRGVPAIQWIALDDAFAELAAQTAANQRLRGADGVFVAVAQQYGTRLVSLDRQQRERAQGIVPALTPDQVLYELDHGLTVL